VYLDGISLKRSWDGEVKNDFTDSDEGDEAMAPPDVDCALS